MIAFDSDSSMASIGGIEKQKEVFGFTPRKVSGGYKEVQLYLAKLFVKEDSAVHDELDDLLGESDIKEVKFNLNAKAKAAGVNGIIIDTITTIGFQTRKQIQGAAPALEMRGWGTYGDATMRFVNLIKGLNCPVIMTSHLYSDKRGAEGRDSVEVTDLKGAGKTDVARFFDVILYTSVQRGKDGVAKYLWQVTPDEKKILAKIRGEEFAKQINPTNDAYIPQDLAPILSAYEKGDHPPKILIIGDSGQGKTTSLSTINS